MPARLVATLPAVLGELAELRAYNKRSATQSKSDQERLLADVFMARAAVTSAVDALCSARVLGSGDVVMPILDEAGYKARDFASVRCAVATVAAGVAMPAHGATSGLSSSNSVGGAPTASALRNQSSLSQRATTMITQRTVAEAEPDKTQLKQAYVARDALRLVWLWDERSVRHFATVAARVAVVAAAAGGGARDTNNTTANELLEQVVRYASPVVVADVAEAITASNGLHACSAKLLSVTLRRTVSAGLSTNGAVVTSGLSSARRLTTALARMCTAPEQVATATTDLLQTEEPTTAELLRECVRPTYGVVTHALHHHANSRAVVETALAALIDTVVLQLLSGQLTPDAAGSIVEEVAEVAQGQRCSAALLQDVLQALRLVVSASPWRLRCVRRALPGPLAQLLRDGVLSGADPSVSVHLARIYYRLFDAPVATSPPAAQTGGSPNAEVTATSATLMALRDAAASLHPLDPRLVTLAHAVRSIEAMWAAAHSSSSSSSGDDPMMKEGRTSMVSDAVREKLTEAMLVSQDPSERIALACALASGTSSTTG